MVDVDRSKFCYHRRPTASSFLWDLWLRVPQILRLTLYRCMMRIGRQTSSPSVFRLPFGLYAKSGGHSNIIEALATQYVSTNTSIPVPVILDILEVDSNRTLFLMTQVPGRPLADMQGNLNTLSKDQLSVFSNTLRDWLGQLRNLPPPDSGSVCGFLGGDFLSYRILFESRVGPFKSQDVFHSRPFCTLRPTADSPAILMLAQSMRQKRYRICLTHGDLSPNNILVDDYFKPTGLVDWECAAWMPEYWELTAALWRRQRYVAWVDAFTRALPQYEGELAVEMELWKTICPF